MRKLFLLFIIFSFGIISYSQQGKLTNTLLWRISGNGLTKPSYLFGTMHLTDKRIFHFGDSLYKALEQTEAFAAELDMNRLGTQMINQLVNNKEEKAAREPVKVRDAVSTEIWKKYKDPLAAKFYKPAEKITLDDLEEMESALKAELFKKGDMPAFLDAYLFGIARKQGKWVGGIEDLQDQIEHINAEDIEGRIQTALFDDKYYRSGIEWLIKMYNAQMLDSIDAMYRGENGQKDYIMIKRNLKMTERMDSLSAIRSTFFAVGVAHLPGDSGVIALLRSKGFTVNPVVSSKKVAPDKYILKTDESVWNPVHIRDSVYALQMPGIAENLGLLQSMGLEMKMFYDISVMKMFMTLSVEIGEDRKKLGADSLYNGIKQQYKKKDKQIKEKRIIINGIEGREYGMSTEEGQMTLQVFIPELEQVILNGVFAIREKSLHDAETVRFFQSFVYNRNFKRSVQPEKNWSRVDYGNHAFSVEMPAMPKEAKDVNSEEGKIIHTYQYIDIKAQVFYGMRISSVKENMYDPGNDSSYFIAIKDRLKTGFEDSRILDSAFISMNHYPGYSIAVSGKSGSDWLETRVITLARGSRNYYLYAVYFPAEDNRLSANRFLNSFKLLPYHYPEWRTVFSPDGSFSTLSPHPLKKIEIEEDEIHVGSERFILYDSAVSATMYFDKTTIPDWVWFDTDTAFLKKRSGLYKALNDSIAAFSITTAGNLKMADFLVLTAGSPLVKKVKLILNGNELYELFTHLSPQDITGLYDRVFDEFKVGKENSSHIPTQSQAPALISVLHNADLKTVNKIKLWWDDLEFSKKDIPALQRLLLKIYPDFDSSYTNNNLNKKIVDKISELDSSHTTMAWLNDNYKSILPENEYIKPFVVSFLSGIKTSESYSLLKEFLINHSFDIKMPVYFSNGFYDSLALTKTLFPEILKFAGSEVLSDYLVGISISLYDSNLISKTVIKQYEKGFIASAKKVLENNKEDIEENGYNYYDWIKILGIINNPEANTLLKKFTRFNDRGIRFRTIIAQLTNNQPVDSRIIYTLATTDEYRHDLFDELKRIGKLNLFPSQYRSQKELGKSKVYMYASDEEPPGLISHAGEKTILYKGKQQKFYLYKVPFDIANSESYLGIAGPYKLDQKDYLSTHEVTGVYWLKEFDAKKINDLFKEYLFSLEESNKEEAADEKSEPPPAAIIK
jgi:uncharacterized protein YbaP (TraB family)